MTGILAFSEKNIIYTAGWNKCINVYRDDKDVSVTVSVTESVTACDSQCDRECDISLRRRFTWTHNRSGVAGTSTGTTS